jgi:alkylated DNA repair dioxygenase AlkB
MTERLASRRLLLLQGAARYEWQHGILARKSDLCKGQRVQRQRTRRDIRSERISGQ